MRSQLFSASAASSMSAGERSAFAPLMIRIAFAPGRVDDDRRHPARAALHPMNMGRVDAEAREVLDRSFGEHVVADLAHHHDRGAELGRRHGLVGALAAKTHLEARRLERLADDRHPRCISDQVDHVASDHADPRPWHLRLLHVGGRHAPIARRKTGVLPDALWSAADAASGRVYKDRLPSNRMPSRKYGGKAQLAVAVTRGRWPNGRERFRDSAASFLGNLYGEGAPAIRRGRARARARPSSFRSSREKAAFTVRRWLRGA